jgi:uncharacterized protein YidB (DUF937 family)
LFDTPMCSTYDMKENEMSHGMPSMTALLGLIAVAGYQNRDKIAEMLGGLKHAPAGESSQSNQQGDTGGVLGNLGASSAVPVSGVCSAVGLVA